MTEQVSNVELAELKVKSGSSKNAIDKDFSLIKDVKVSLTAFIGESQLSVEELFSLKQGSVVTLNKELNEAIDLFINEKLVAKGNIVAVKDSYGIEITEII